MLTFVHISDLHIGQDGSEAVDRDEDPRKELIRDCERIKPELEGEVSGVLISGDIAHSGAAEQYGRARQWIRALCDAVGTGEENVWTVPGNHDFDQDAPTRLWQSACAELRECDLGQIDTRLTAHLDSVDKGVLLEPLRAYHEFAANFRCVPPGPVQVWDQPFELTDRLKLRVLGLNTAILADGTEAADGSGLVLGERALQLPRDPDFFNLAIWHHPLYWLRDAQIADSYLSSRATIHLFGHDHDHRLDATDSVLSVSAGALHPRRGKTKWDPRYNVIEIAATGTEVDDGLDVSVIPRQWDSTGTRFAAEDGDLAVTRRQFRVGAQPVVCEPRVEVPSSESVPAEPEPAVNASADSYETDGGQHARGRVASRARLLTLRYATLPYVKRLLVAGELGLLCESDRAQPSFEQTRLVLERAMTRHLLEQLWDAVVEQGEEGEMGPNPYAGAPR